MSAFLRSYGLGELLRFKVYSRSMINVRCHVGMIFSSFNLISAFDST